MTANELIKSVKYVVDDTGQRKAVQLDIEIWEQIVALLTSLGEEEAERRWDELFASSQDALIKLANEALEEHRQGLTKPLDPDQL